MKITRFSNYFFSRGWIDIFIIAIILTSTNCKSSEKKIQHFKLHNVRSRSKRGIADISFTDRLSRHYAHHSRHQSLSRLVSHLDDASRNGNKCPCSSGRNRYSKTYCPCNVQSLFTNLLKTISSPSKANSDEVDSTLRSLDRKTRMQLFQLTATNLKHFIRSGALERRRKGRKFRRFMRKRHLRRKYPRSAFDKLPLFSF